ncbi:MAG: ABC transporter ATP-binding protein [Rhodospirillaceae bacterium]|nr:ABC transporter ATP-binding protein [Rhodospirillaceae bacterium]
MATSGGPVDLLQVRGLSVSFRSRGRTTQAVSDLSFTVGAGETLAVVGESGSGKSVTALAIMRLVEREGGTIDKGSLLFRCGDRTVDLARLDDRQMRAYRGNEISMIFQEPMTSLNPVFTVGNQLVETIRRHRPVGARAAADLAAEALQRVRMTDPLRRLAQYPHELSGGMRQRVMIAMALACSPRLLIADEPTTALDATVQAEILDLIGELQQSSGMSVIFITHDMGVVAEIADRVVVLRQGERVEEADTRSLFGRPRAAYTRALLAAVPKLGSGAPAAVTVADGAPLMEVANLVTRFPVRTGPFKRLVARVHAVEDVSFTLHRGETLGLVGESGSGKSTIGRSILKLVEPTAGAIRLEGRDIAGLTRAAMMPVRRDMQMVFQDPYASLNPRLPVSELVTEPLAIHTRLTRRQRRDVAAELLRRVSLPPDALDRYPHQFSGGQRQRLCIARALSVKPKMIVADEPVSALDVSVQAQVIDLMRELQATDGIAYLFISHDIAVVEQMSHRVAVLEQGRIVEIGPTDAVLSGAGHPYTRRLLAAVPVADPTRPRRHRPERFRAPASAIYPLDHSAPPMSYRLAGTAHWVAEGAPG